MKSLLRHVNVLNLALAAALLFSLNYNINAGLPKYNSKTGKTSGSGGAGRPAGTGGLQKTLKKSGTPLKDSPNGVRNAAATDSFDSYAVIASQNLFSPKRMIPVEKVVLPLPPRPDLILRGTMITADVTLAYIEEKNGPAGLMRRQAGAQFPYRRGPRRVYSPVMYAARPGGLAAPAGTADKAKLYRIGDSINGFVLRNIEPDKVFLIRGRETMEVLLSPRVTDLPGMNFPAGPH